MIANVDPPGNAVVQQQAVSDPDGGGKPVVAQEVGAPGAADQVEIRLEGVVVKDDE